MMLTLIVSLLTIFSAGQCALTQVHPYIEETYNEVLNYHKAVHLFYQDWICDTYGKANLTTKEQQYYDSLFMKEPVPRPSPHDEVYYLLSKMRENQPTGKLLNNIMGLFKDFHDELIGYLEEKIKDADLSSSTESQSRRKRQVDDLTAEIQELMGKLGNLGHLTRPERRVFRQTVRQTIRNLAVGAWRKFLVLRRKARRARLSGSPAPSPSIGEPPSSPDTNEPPSGPGDIAAPPPPETPAITPGENIPIPNPTEEDQIIGNSPAGKRKKRSLDDNNTGRDDDDVRDEIFSVSPANREQFEAALKWMMTERPEGGEGGRIKNGDGLSNYDIFVMKHRMAENPQAYSKEDNFGFHSRFLNRFEHALQQFNQNVKIPYIDVCQMLLNPVFDNIQQIQGIVSADNVGRKVIDDCTWIGENLKRSPSLSSIALKKLDEAFYCSNTNVTTIRSFGMDEYAALHSLFGPCVKGGSHMACPSCAVADPIFWLFYANIERVLQK